MEEKKKRIISRTEIYRALAVGEDKLICGAYRENLLSEIYSKIIDSSVLNKDVTLHCFTEDLRVALKYAKKEGYSGEIAKLDVEIYSDGTCKIKGIEEAFVYRLWMMKDWVNLVGLGENEKIKNININKEVSLISILSLVGRRTARGFARSSKTWVIHTETPIEYKEILSKTEKEKNRAKKYYLKSYKKIFYPKNVLIKGCNRLIEEMQILDLSEEYRIPMELEIEKILKYEK